jgi:tetratricopeptide (TPR) repeat protein
VDKKAEKQTDFILKPEGGDSSSVENGIPELVANDSTSSDTTAHALSPVANEQHSESAVQNSVSAPLPRAVKEKRKSLPFFRRRPRPALLAVLALLILWIPLQHATNWYFTAPRPSRPMDAPPFVVVPLLAVVTAWVGEPDASYAFQLAPVMMHNAKFFGKPDAKEMGEEKELRKIGLGNIDSFIQQSAAKDHQLSILAKSMALYTSGRSAEAAIEIESVTSGARNPMLKSYRAGLLAVGGDLYGALAELNKCIAMVELTGRRTFYYHQIYPWIQKAHLLMAMGRPEDALATLNSPFLISLAEQRVGSRADILLCKAAVYLQLGEPDKAIAVLNDSPDSALAQDQILLSTAYLMKAEYSKAVEAAKDSSQTDFALSRIYSNQGAFNKALTYAEKADKELGTLYSLEQRVYVLNQLGRYADALALSKNLFPHTESGAGISGGDLKAQPEMHADRALAFVKLGMPKEALVEAGIALRRNENCRSALEAARLASLSLGDRAGVAFYDSMLKKNHLPPGYRPIFQTKSWEQ